jgi:hypothetical protein
VGFAQIRKIATKPSTPTAGPTARLGLASLGAGGVPLVADDEALVCVDVANVDPLRLVDSESLVVDVLSDSEEETVLELTVL